MQTPDFSAYKTSHWRCLLHVESWIVDNEGPFELWRVSADDVDVLIRDGLLAPANGPSGPAMITTEFYVLTDRGWAVAHALRRHRGQCGNETVRLPLRATAAFESVG
jgi:hypothetical protein